MSRYVQSDHTSQQVSLEQRDDYGVIAFSNGYIFSLSNVVQRYSAERNASDPLVSEEDHTNHVDVYRPSQPPRYQEYDNYERRMHSYRFWINSSPCPETLCKAGFFYTGREDLVRCYQCGIGLKDFSAEDDPLTEHVRHSGNCLFLLDNLGPTRLADIKREIELRDNGLFTQGTNQQNGHVRHPRYSSLESRIKSFVNWPSSVIQTPARLAESGFFFTGIDDQVRCFACDGGLRRWDPEDDPWTEHCRWFPSCPYARATKGEEFIALVQASTQQEFEPVENEHVPEPAVNRPHLDPAFREILDGYRAQCREMGFEQIDIEEGIQALINRGNVQPSLYEILDAIEIAQERRHESSVAAAANSNETPLEENQRLKKTLMCMFCEKNTVNALLLPCTHHRLCMECAKSLTVCPLCQRTVNEKIRTFLV